MNHKTSMISKMAQSQNALKSDGKTHI